MLNYECTTAFNYNNSIFCSINFLSSIPILLLSNIADSVIDGFPIVNLIGFFNLQIGQLSLVNVQVVPENGRIPITITGLLNYMQQAIQQAYSSNTANNKILYPFNNPNLFGKGVDVVQLTKNLAANSVTTQGVNLGNFTYILTFIQRSQNNCSIYKYEKNTSIFTGDYFIGDGFIRGNLFYNTNNNEINYSTALFTDNGTCLT